MVGLTSSVNRADAYGVFADAPDGGEHLIICVKQDEIERVLEGATRTISEVTFDEADILGTFREPGHPGVIGLWLTSSSSTPIVGDAADLDPFDYTVTEASGDRGYMVRRGFVYPPTGGGPIAFP